PRTEIGAVCTRERASEVDGAPVDGRDLLELGERLRVVGRAGRERSHLATRCRGGPGHEHDDDKQRQGDCGGVLHRPVSSGGVGVQRGGGGQYGGCDPGGGPDSGSSGATGTCSPAGGSTPIWRARSWRSKASLRTRRSK